MIDLRRFTLLAPGALAVAVGLAGCGSNHASASSNAGAASSTSASAAAVESQPAPSEADGGPTAVEGGDLLPGVVYFSEALGVSVQPTEDGWFALLAGDTDFELTRERIAVWFVNPASIRPDGSAASTEEAPTDPAAFVEAMDGHPAVTVVDTEPFPAGDLDGLLVNYESSGMAEGSALLVTSDGAAFGFPDGEGRLVLLTTDAGLVMVSVEGGDSRDAAWEIAEPLITTIDAAP